MTNENAMLMVNGTTALIEKLGVLDAERFIFNLTKAEPFDYTEWQRSLYDNLTLEELVNKAAGFSAEHPIKLQGVKTSVKE
ncbi:hypothetical protein ACYULU_05360 [Breznakiellaceae bacterium SP9]